jgi:hypothetical protein
MTTATQVIHDALQEILVQADEQDYQASEYQAGKRALNDMMQEWDASGLSLGFTLIDNITNTVTVAAGLIGAVKTNLAMRLAPQFDVAITPGLLNSAKSGMQAVRNIAVTTNPTSLPSILPVGSGNEDEYYSTRRFFPPPEDGVLAEDNGDVNLESGT